MHQVGGRSKVEDHHEAADAHPRNSQVLNASADYHGEKEDPFPGG